MCTSWLDNHLMMTSHRCIQRSQRTQLKNTSSVNERVREKGARQWERERERELARMCVWDNARDEKCLTPGESDVPERMSWEKWRLADETVVVSSDVFHYWVPSDYPPQLCHFNFNENVSDNFVILQYWKSIWQLCNFINSAGVEHCVVAFP